MATQTVASQTEAVMVVRPTVIAEEVATEEEEEQALAVQVATRCRIWAPISRYSHSV